MRYLGGKGRLGKQIALSILASTPRRDLYLEPFLGGANSFMQISPYFARPHCSDIHEDLVLMWQAVRAGWVPPVDLTEEQYEWLRHQPPSALRGFAGFPCSFGGMWFTSFARNVRGQDGGHNYAESGSRTVVKARAALARAVVTRASYHQWSSFVEANATNFTVYCDPPYANTSGYSAAASGFDHEYFWRTLDRWSDLGAHVFVSEYTAPPHWRVVGEAEHSCNVVGGKVNQMARLEKLFTRVPGAGYAQVAPPNGHAVQVRALPPRVAFAQFSRTGVMT